MKNYVALVALVLGLFGGITPAFGEIMVGDNVTFLDFGEGGESGLNSGTVLDISEDGDWLLIYTPPDYLTAISKWFIYSDETIANQLLTNLLASGETYEPTGRDYEANDEEYKFREHAAQQNTWPRQQRASEEQQLWRPNTAPRGESAGDISIDSSKELIPSRIMMGTSE
ncbi:MAG: hypothetical protein LUQ38_03155 [Methanotrichaceae archaeon]|nr:hypothetical protein [Methanotrichaceae archaeon]MDD1757804.1 hypothetical protein [Methanotrichaceae archaeon]